MHSVLNGAQISFLYRAIFPYVVEYLNVYINKEAKEVNHGEQNH